jgi:flagellar hook-associated protein 1 FlgK
MRSSFMGLEVQKRTLQMAQKSLDIVGHNISNEKTPGFTRQRVDIHSMNISSFSFWQTRLSKLSLAGQGVSAFGVSQIRNNYLDKRYRDIAPIAKEHDTKMKIMLELETTLDAIDNVSLLDALHNLKSAMQKVSLVSPDALEMTSLVRNQAQNICRMLQAYSSDLQQLLQRNLTNLSDSIRGTNNLIDKIVQYNKAITGEYLLDAGRIASGRGVSEYGPLEMIDQRNLLLDELAEFGNIEVFQNSNGSVRVTMAGVTIIDDQFSEKLVMRNYEDYGAAYITFSNGIDFIPRNGEIKAFMDMVSGYGPYAVGQFQNSEYGIPYYLQALDAFAEGFASLMNEVNKGFLNEYQAWNRSLIWGGYELDSNGRKIPLLDDDGFMIFLDNAGKRIPVSLDANGDQISPSGVEPLYVKAKITAANIRISDEWLNNPMTIGETFNTRSLNDFSIGRSYQIGEVFRDPATGLYFFVETAFQANSSNVGDYVRSSNVRDIPVFRGEAPDWSNADSYREGDIFFDPNTGIYYRVTAEVYYRVSSELGEGRPIASALAAGDIEAIGVHEGEWQSANLDGSNLHRFVAALESNRSWGRANDFNGTVYGYLEFLSDRLGQGIEFLANSFDISMDTIHKLLDNRDAISAVSETEEGINMLTYQKWFNASARLMTTMDEALDTIINRMGRVGL